MKDHIIICGLGTIGFRTFDILHRAKQKMVVISSTTHDEWRWQVEEAGGIFYLGDARNDKLLIKAGIQQAKAILALTDQDIVNVSIAMDARSLNPNIKIILRMFDAKLGKHIQKAYGVDQIFSSSDLTAPIFASSTRENKAIAEFKVDKKNYFVFEESRTASQAAGANALTKNFPEAVQPHHSHKVLIAHPVTKPKKKENVLSLLFKKFNYFRSPIFSNFRRFLFILLSFILLSALIIKMEMTLDFIDALYFVTTTVTTVGYGDYNFSHASPHIKLFGCLLMLTGAAAIAILFSSITEIILSKKLPGIVGGRPVPRKNHVIVVGAGPVGQKIISLLLEDQIPVVIIEGDEKDRYADDINRQVALVDGYLRSDDTLKRANVQKAKAIIVITDDDVQNLSVSLAAKKLNPEIIDIIHVFSSTLGKRLKSALALNRVFSIPTITAPYFAAAIFGKEILLALQWQNQLIFLSRESGSSVTDDCLNIDGRIYKNIHLHSIPLE